ncbi:MAG: spore coat protein [Hydrogenibacillus sp.]|nr:spore coat protein [Hydrogenibacillus sp.]
MAQTRTTIVPPQPSISPSPQMSDRDYANDALTTEKYLTAGLNTAAWEASNGPFHQDLMKLLNDTHQAARRVYDFMFAQGWYPIDVEDQQNVDEAFQQYDQEMKTQFPPQGMVQ